MITPMEVLKNQLKITYNVMVGYRTSSKSTEIEDALIQDYKLRVNDIELTMKEYDIEKGNRWLVTFSRGDVHYIMMIMNEDQENVKKIVNNLIFY